MSAVKAPSPGLVVVGLAAAWLVASNTVLAPAPAPPRAPAAAPQSSAAGTGGPTPLPVPPGGVYAVQGPGRQAQPPALRPGPYSASATDGEGPCQWVAQIDGTGRIASGIVTGSGGLLVPTAATSLHVDNCTLRAAITAMDA